MGKRKKSRRQQLREIQERRQRYLPKVKPVPFSLGRFLQQHLPEIIFISLFILAIVFVYTYKYRDTKSQEIAALSSSVSKGQIAALHQSYPEGFRVFVLSKGNILPLNIDSLPQELNVEWGPSKIIMLTRDKIWFQLGPIAYQSQVIIPSLVIKLPRHEGKASQEVAINKIQITVELIGEYSTGIFCALGFKKE